MRRTIISSLVIIAFIAVVVVNVLANTLPINGVATGEVSDSYPDLFAPAGITFSIWGLIYLLLGAYAVHQALPATKRKEALLNTIGVLFIASSLANIAWLFSWHYDRIGLSLFFMVVLLYSLIRIADTLREERLSRKEFFFLRLPFSVYFGWITVATIANVTAFLVSANWNGWGVAEATWTIIILIVGAAIGITRALYDKSVPYLLVFVWAYTGILIKHLSAQGFFASYPGIIITAALCIASFLAAITFLFIRKNGVLTRTS